jgi:hypothetical protein
MRLQGFGLGVRTNACVDQAAPEGFGVCWRVERDGVFLCSGRSKVMRAASDGYDERVVRKLANGCHCLAKLVVVRGDLNDTPAAIEAGHFTDAVAEVVPMSLGHVAELMVLQVEAACRDLVQVRLPEVSALAIDERNARQTLSTQAVTEGGRQLEPCRTAPDDHDSMGMAPTDGSGHA